MGAGEGFGYRFKSSVFNVCGGLSKAAPGAPVPKGGERGALGIALKHGGAFVDGEDAVIGDVLPLSLDPDGAAVSDVDRRGVQLFHVPQLRRGVG